jgi:hypothetical protein
MSARRYDHVCMYEYEYALAEMVEDGNAAPYRNVKAQLCKVFHQH